MLISTFSSLREVSADLRVGKTHGKTQELAGAIYKTISFFDMFDYPLTAWEAYKYLWKENLEEEFGFLDLKNALDESSIISEQEGFYFLRGRGEIVGLRKERYNIAAKKYRRAKLVANILSVMPYVKMIAVSNSLAYDNARDNSDIDLFIITSKEKIWTARFFTTLFLKVFHLRPTAKNKKNSICLNFFVAQDFLNLKDLRVANDIYFIYWLKFLKPLYDEGNFFKDFNDANGWVNNYINCHDFCRTNIKRRIKQIRPAHFCKVILEKLFSFSLTENIFKKLQLAKLPREIKSQANISNDVVINDSVLKFHHQDRRRKFRDEWHKRIKNYEL